MNEVIAYTIGSYWFCPECEPKEEDYYEPVTADNLMSIYRYDCDQCGKLIREMEEQ